MTFGPVLDDRTVRRHDGTSLRTRVALLSGILLVLTLMAVLAIVAASLARDHASQDERHANDARLDAARLLSSLVDQETGMRGFLLTGDEAVLASYTTGRREAKARLIALRAESPRLGEAASVRQIEALTTLWRQQAALQIRARREHGLDVAATIVNQGLAKRRFDEVRGAIAALDGRLRREVTIAMRSRDQANTALVLTAVAVVLLLLAMAAIGVYVLNRWIIAPIDELAAAATRVALGDLDANVPTNGPAEVAELGASVETMRETLLARLATARRAVTAADDANRRLQASNAELEAFGYSVSHDLRAPLRTIDGFSQALTEDAAGQLDDRGLHYVERIRSGVLRMNRLIEDLLELSRIGRREMRHEHVDLSTMAGEIVTNLREGDPGRHVDVVVPAGLDAVGDSALVRIVLENLLGNAWKYTRERPDARIELGRESVGGASRYFVRDNGVGFDMAYADRLFGVFQRLHGDDRFEGTGIGLATVARIVHRHGGEVGAEGAVGEGATFWFTLARAGQGDEADA